MATLYDRPIKSDVTVTPFTMPVETLEKGLLAKQERFDDIIKTAETYQSQIESIESRPGVEDDINFLKNTSDEFRSTKNDFYSQLEGDFSSMRISEIQSKAAEVLNPKRSILEAIASNNELYKQRQALKADYEAQGLKLDFDDSLEKGASFDENGNPIVYKSTGIEKRSDWLGGIKSLFDNIKSSSIESNAVTQGAAGDTKFKQVIKKSISSNERDITIGDETIETNKIKNIIDTQVDEFIDADSRGNQMFRWFRKYYTDKILSENPDTPLDAVQAIATQRAKDRIKSAITDVSFNYAQTDIVANELTDLMQVEPKTKTSRGSDDEIEIPNLLGTPVTTYVNPTDMTLEEIKGEGTGFSYITSEMEAINSPFDPNGMSWNSQFNTIGSIPAAVGALLYAGPRDQSDITNTYQHQDLNLTRKGYLQRLDDLPNSQYAGKNNRAVRNVQGEELNKYITYLKEKNDPSLSRQIEELEKISDKGEPYTISTMDVQLSSDGTYSLVPNEFFSDNEEVLNQVNQFKEDRAEELAVRLAHLDSLESKKRSLKDRRIAARNASGFTSEDDLRQAESGANQKKEQYEEFMKGSDDAYMRALGLSGRNVNFINTQFTNKTDEGTETNEVRDALLDFSKKAVSSGYKTANNYAITKYGYEIGTKEFWTSFLDDYDISDLPSGTPDPFASTGMTNISDQLAANVGTNLVIGFSKNMREDYLKYSNEHFEENKKDLDTRLIKYYKHLDNQLDPFYINNMQLSFPSGEKDFMDDLSRMLVTSIMQDGLWRIKPSDSGVSEEEKVTLNELREEAYNTIVREQGGSADDIPSILSDLTPKDLLSDNRILGFRIDPGISNSPDNIVVDVNIGGKMYEVRNIKGLKEMLSGNKTINGKFLDLMTQYSQSLRNNDYTSGIINIPIDPINPSNTVSKEIFVALSDDDEVVVEGTNSNLKKGQVFIYEDGRRKGFESPEKAIKYVMETNKDSYNFERDIATPLAIPDADFEIRYGVTKEEYRQEYDTKIRPKLLRSNLITDILTTNNLNKDNYLDNSNQNNTYIIPFENRKKEYFTTQGYQEEDIEVTNNNAYRLKINTYNSDNLPDNLSMKPGSFINNTLQMMPAFERAFNALPEDIPTQVITNARRSLEEHAELYMNSKDKMPGYSDHFMGQAIDLQSSTEAGKEFISFLQTEEGQKWMDDNNLYVLIHNIGGGQAEHIHVKYNLPVTLVSRKTIESNRSNGLVIQQ